MKSRSIAGLGVAGISLVILPVCLLGLSFLLAKWGIIDAWTGIAVSYLGFQLLRWLGGIGVSFVLIAVLLRKRSLRASRRSWRVSWAFVIVLFLLSGFFVGFLPQILMSALKIPPPAFWRARVILGAERFSREVAYRLPDIGVVTDIQQDKNNQLTIAGRRGAAFVHAGGAPIETVPFQECKSEVVSVWTAKNEGPYFLCRGGWVETPVLFDSRGRSIWTLGISGDGVDDSAVAGFGDGLAVAVGFNGTTGIHLVDPLSSGGRELWSVPDDGNIWHTEITSSEKYPEGFVVHSNVGGELVVRDKNGIVLSRQKAAIYLAKFSLTEWGTDSRLDKLVAFDENGVYVLSMDGNILARFPIDHDAQVTNIKATSLHVSDGSSYFAIVQDYAAWHRSRLRIYDQQNLPVYEEVMGDDCVSLRAIPDHANTQTLLLGCNGTVFGYGIRRATN